MADPEPTGRFLDVPGARLYYEARGDGPPLLLIGSPVDSTGFAGLARALADRYTVITYDPRGIGSSSRQDATADITPGQQAGDVYQILTTLGVGPAYVFGSSGGGVVGLALVTARPGQVRALVAHEPPVLGLLPDNARVREQMDDIYRTYQADGADRAMAKFLACTGIGGPPGRQPGQTGQAGEPRQQPTAEQMARIRAANEVFFAHLLLPTTSYQPDLAALRASATPVIIGAGAASKGQLPHRATVALAQRLGATVTEFPGGHAGFAALPAQFGEILHQVLTAAAPDR